MNKFKNLIWTSKFKFSFLGLLDNSVHFNMFTCTNILDNEPFRDFCC